MSEEIRTIDVGIVESVAYPESFVRTLSEAIQRVRELHTQESEITTFCKECSFMYPCDTIKALDGEQ